MRPTTRAGTARQVQRPVIDLERGDGVIFDADGVVTDTSRIHAAAWKTVFDGFLRARSAQAGEEFRPFHVRDDYLRFVHGKPRLDGVRAFLASRGIELPPSDAGGGPDEVSVATLAARKEAFFRDQLRRYGVAAFPSVVSLVRELRRRGAGTAAVSSSRHCARVLAAAGVGDMFDARVDGVDVDESGLAGKPDPALFLEAARRLGKAPGRACVVEDSLAGTEAARRGGFGLVLGVSHGARDEDLYARGADIVVRDLGDVQVAGRIA